MNRNRTGLFERSIASAPEESGGWVVVLPSVRSEDEDLLLFHTQRYVDFVKEASASGEGYLDFPDTPAFPGVYEATLHAVGSTLFGLRQVMEGKLDHFFNPVGGLHHAARDRASGFCVFNDAGIAIARALKDGLKTVAYVDIDAHHGDGVYYGFESDPRVVFADIHEDGRTLFPGTGAATEKGSGNAVGTKRNIPLVAGSGDAEFFEAFDEVYDFVAESRPDFIFMQCGADGLLGDPLTNLRYSSAAHSHAAGRLHALAHEVCGGRILAMGGGGYSPENVNSAWSAVIEELTHERRE